MSDAPQIDFATDVLIDQLAAAFLQREAELKLEQAVYGLDSLEELGTHGIVAEGYSPHYSVAREVHYPSSVGKKLSHRQRCDLVLAAKDWPLRLDSKPPDLFENPQFTQPQHAFWLEVKQARQFKSPGEHHGGYGQQWRRAIVADLRKMSAEPLIRHAGLLMVVYTESAEIAAKDLLLFERELIKQDVVCGFVQSRCVPIQDRIGHRACTMSLYPTLQPSSLAGEAPIT